MSDFRYVAEGNLEGETAPQNEDELAEWGNPGEPEGAGVPEDAEALEEDED